jgi:hypothetical protein
MLRERGIDINHEAIIKNAIFIAAKLQRPPAYRFGRMLADCSLRCVNFKRKIEYLWSASHEQVNFAG